MLFEFEKKEKTCCCVVFSLREKTTQQQVILPIFRIAELLLVAQKSKLYYDILKLVNNCKKSRIQGLLVQESFPDIQKVFLS